MYIPDDQIEQVRLATDIVEVVNAYVPLKRKGQNYLGLCPFHSEKTPSFTVHREKGIFHCFGCGEGGNVFGFLMKAGGVDFPGAVRQLADRYGVALTLSESPKVARQRGEREKIRRANEAAQAYFVAQLAAADGVASGYLTRRGLDQDTIKRFGLGWAPDRWDGLTGELTAKGISTEDASLAGLTSENDRGRRYDRFRGRVMFPIHTAGGELVGFGGRVVADGTPKYLNTPETAAFHKGSLLYGLYQARTAGGELSRIAVVEGYLDVIACQRHGITGAVAPLGTALTEAHGRLLARYTDRVVLVFDGDRAGQAAARKAVAILAPLGLEVAVAVLPNGEDPDSILAVGGQQRLEEYLDRAEPMIEFLLRDALTGLQGAAIERRLTAVQPVGRVVQQIPDPVRRGYYAGVLAEALGVDEATLRKQLAKPDAPASRPVAASIPEPVAVRVDEKPLPGGEDLLLHLVVQGRVGADWLYERLVPSAFSDPRAQRLMQRLTQLVEAQQPVDGLVALLADEPALLALVTGWMSRDVTVEGDPLECAAACVADLARRESRAMGLELVKEIRRAEANGEDARLLALLRQKDALSKMTQSSAAESHNAVNT